MDGRAVAAQQGLAHAVEVDDDRNDLVVLLRAVRDRIADELVRKRRRDLRHVDDALRVRAGGQTQCNHERHDLWMVRVLPTCCLLRVKCVGRWCIPSVNGIGGL